MPTRSSQPKTPASAPALNTAAAQSTHKERFQWFNFRANYPLRDAPPLELERFWSQHEQFPSVRGVWQEAGPFNFAGRVTALVVDPKDPKKVFAGSAGGGVWRSTDGCQTWTSCWPRFANQNIGALAMHPADGNQLICGTGEANLSADSYPGSGVYFSRDGGLSWAPFFSAPDGGPLAPEAMKMFPRRVGTIAFGHSTQALGLDFRIALGTVSHDEHMPAALYLDQGANGLLPNTVLGSLSYNCHAILFHPKRAGLLFVAIEPRGSQNGIWRSDDFGQSWTQLRNGLPPGEQCGRISLAMSSSDPDVMYALAADRKKQVLGVFRTTDGAKTWREVGGNQFPAERFMSYNNTIAIHPAKPEFAVWGGADLYRTKDGGKNWTKITTPQRGQTNFVHSDQHAVVMPGGDLIYAGNDGGVSVSEDGGDTWQERSAGMVTTMFYAVDVAPTNSTVFGGGAQDAGTLIAGVGGKPGEFTRVLAGDGGWLTFDPTDEQHVFGSSQNFDVARHRAGEPWSLGVNVGAWKDVAPDNIDDNEKSLRAIAVMAIEPGKHAGIRKVWVGTNRLWRTDDDGQSWNPVSPYFDGTVISAIEISAANPDVMFVGTTNGGIFLSTDRGATWSENLAGLEIPQRLITRIKMHPTDANTVVVTCASTGSRGASLKAADGQQAADGQPYSHVFRSRDLGQSWEDIDGGKLPNVIHNALAYETHPPFRIFVGGDAGVFLFDESGSEGCWLSVAGGLPNVLVSDLNYHDKDRILTAATYGRGIWRLSLKDPLIPVAALAAVAGDPETPGLEVDPSAAIPKLTSPGDGTVFDIFPRNTRLTWEPVPGAIAYGIEISSPNGIIETFGSDKPELTFAFFGAAEGRWRVWAILPVSRRSPVSESRSFRYTQ